jgi:hypothetical protein
MPFEIWVHPALVKAHIGKYLRDNVVKIMFPKIKTMRKYATPVACKSQNLNLFARVHFVRQWIAFRVQDAISSVWGFSWSWFFVASS